MPKVSLFQHIHLVIDELAHFVVVIHSKLKFLCFMIRLIFEKDKEVYPERALLYSFFLLRIHRLLFLHRKFLMGLIPQARTREPPKPNGYSDVRAWRLNAVQEQ